MIFCAVVMIVAPVVLSTLSSDNMTATDWTYRHSLWIERYLAGDFTPILEYIPLFHWLLAPFVAVSFPMKYFQIVFVLLSTAGILYYTYNKEGETATLYASILLASSIAFVEFASALMPQALDYALFPLVLLFYFKDRVKTTLVSLVALFFFHTTGMVFITILLIHSLITRRYKFFFPLLVLAIVIAPLFIYYIHPPDVIRAILKYDSATQQEWERLRYMTPSYNLLLFSGFMTWILLPYASYKLFKRKFILTDTQKLYIIWILCFVPIWLNQMGLWRMLSFQIVPLSLFVASILGEKNAS